MWDVFNSIQKSLKDDHAITETDYKHEFDATMAAGKGDLKSSPYMVVKAFNDKLETDPASAPYRYLDGRVQDDLEVKTLEKCPLPGVNWRQDMPAKAVLKQAIRESDQNRIIQYCGLPANQTKRCLILHACEGMMREAMKERSFSFLDRNYVEEFKDAHTFRQVLAQAIFLQRADLQTKYFEMDDGLLVGLYYKNPPGRLLRRQWTSDTKVMPCFSEWLAHLKDHSKLAEVDSFLDIKQSAVGLLKENVKYSFPSDNSIIRVTKNQAGGKRMGESQIMKDNFLFGLNEKKEVY